jgi:predicted metal-dependent HD superfamily phosphohydrolase
LADTSGPDHTGAIDHALARLLQDLPAELTYHNLYHTEQEVLPAARRLAGLCSVNEEDLLLLEVAAAYHDIGFTVQAAGHEILGAEIAAGVLPAHGFSPAQIEIIRSMILATRWPQCPQNPLEEILVDADLDVLGCEDYGVRNQALRTELAAQGRLFSTEEWLRSQLELLRGHRYFTTAARTLRDGGKRKNLAAAEKCLAALRDQD